MKTETLTEKGYKKIVSFEADKTEMDKNRKISFDKFRKQAKVDGFRPGKAPESMIRQRYGATIEAEAVNEAVNSMLREYLTGENLYPISEPVVSEIKNENDMLVFSVSFEVYPEFELKEHKDLTVEHLKFEFTEKEIDDAVNELLDKHSTSKETGSAIDQGHIVDVSIRPSGQSDAEWESRSVEIGKNPNDKIDGQFKGLKKGDIKTVNLGAGETDGKDYDFDIRIDKVGEKILPDFNDEFAKTLDSKYSCAADLRNEIAESLRKKKQSELDAAVYDKIAAKIIYHHKNFEVPASVLEKYLEDLLTNTKKQYGSSIDMNMIRNIYGKNAELSLKWEYIRHKIVDEYGLIVTDGDVQSRISEIASESSVDIEKVRKYYSGKDKTGMLKQDILEKKLRKFLTENNNVVFVDKLPEEEQLKDEKPPENMEE